MPCVNHSLGRSEPVQAAATSRSHRRQRPSPHDLVSDLVALPAGLHPPSGLPWIPSGSHHHKHFRNCSYHRKHKPLCHGSHRRHRRRSSLDPLDEPRSRPDHCQSSGSGSGSGSALSSWSSSSPSSRRVFCRWSSASKPSPARNFVLARVPLATDLKQQQQQQQQQQRQSQSSTSSSSSIGCHHPCDTTSTTTTTNLVVFVDDRLISLLRDRRRRDPVSSSQNCSDDAVSRRPLNISSFSSSPATTQLLLS